MYQSPWSYLIVQLIKIAQASFEEFPEHVYLCLGAKSENFPAEATVPLLFPPLLCFPGKK